MVLYHEGMVTKFLAQEPMFWENILSKEPDEFLELPLQVMYQTVFNKYIRSDPAIAEKYHRFMLSKASKDNLLSMESALDSPIVQEVYALIKKYGWFTFRAALVEIATRLSSRAYNSGMSDLGNQWSKIRDKLSNIRRSCKLP